MRHTVYALLFWLFMGYLACFSCFTQNALAAPQVINMHNAASLPGKQAYDQNANEEYIRVMKKRLDTTSHSSEDQVGKGFRSDFLRDVHASEAFSHHAFNFPWPSIKVFDISSLWKQQRDKHKKKDAYDYGE